MVWVMSYEISDYVIMCFCDVNQEGSNRLDVYTVDVRLRNAYAR